MVGGELENPELSLIDVTNVVISRDLRNAKVYVYHQNEDVSREQVIQGLDRAVPFLRSQLAARTTLRAVPELLFIYDDTPERAARVDEILSQIAAEREQRGEATDAAS